MYSIAPLGHATAIFIKCEPNELIDFLKAWNTDLGYQMKTQTTNITLTSMFQVLDERTPYKLIAAAVPHLNGWTAYFDNAVAEGLSNSTASMACKTIGTDVAGFSFDHDRPPHTGSATFSYYQPTEEDVNLRYVQLFTEHSGEFHQSGDPLLFEDLAAYRRSNIKQRVTREMLIQYANHLGIYPDDISSYGNPITLLTRVDYRTKEEREAKYESDMQSLFRVLGFPIKRFRSRSPEQEGF